MAQTLGWRFAWDDLVRMAGGPEPFVLVERRMTEAPDQRCGVEEYYIETLAGTGGQWVCASRLQRVDAQDR